MDHAHGSNDPVVMNETIARTVTLRTTLVGHASIWTGTPAKKDDILVIYELELTPHSCVQGKVQWYAPGHRVREKKRARDEGKPTPSFAGHSTSAPATSITRMDPMTAAANLSPLSRWGKRPLASATTEHRPCRPSMRNTCQRWGRWHHCIRWHHLRSSLMWFKHSHTLRRCK